MKKVCRTVFSPDVFKAVMLLASILGVCPLLAEAVTPYLKLLHLYALVVLVLDLTGEQRILKNRGRALLPVFCLGYVVTLLLNPNLINFSGFSNFAYLLETLALVYSYGAGSKKMDSIMSTVFAVLISAANLAGIWMFYTKFYLYIPGRGYVGMFPSENRLCGLFGNPGVLGVVCMAGLCLSCIQFVRCEQRWKKVCFAGLGLINFITLLLCNSRAQLCSLALLAGVIAVMQVLKRARKKKRWVQAAITLFLCAGIIFGGSKLCQRGLSKLDVYYEYYVSGVYKDSDVAKFEEYGEWQAEKEESTISRDASSFLNGRPELWYMGVQIFKEKSLFGCGMDNFKVTLENMGQEDLPVRGNLHNVYLEVLVVFGLVGFACLALFALTVIKSIYTFFRYGDRENWTLASVMLASVLAYMLAGLADSTLVASVYPTSVSFWVILSQLVQLTEEENARSGHDKPAFLAVWTEKMTAKRKRK